MFCELCGKRTKDLYKVEIEGTEMVVCKECSRYGKVIGKYSTTPKPRPVKKVKIEEKEEIIIPEYAEIVRSVREREGLSIEEFAKKIGERESTLRSIERGEILPDEKFIKKFEKQFNVKLTQEIKLTEVPRSKEKPEALTLGDVVKVRKR